MTTKKASVNVRESMNVLPKYTQPFITWLTAKPLNHDDRNSNRTAVYHVFTACISVFLGVFGSILLLKLGGVYSAFLFITLILTVSGFRKLQVVIYHHCSHNNVFKNKLSNFILGEVISIVLLIKDFKTYSNDHMVHHNAKGLLTHKDETVQDLSSVHLFPGLSKKTLYRNMLVSFVSPFSQLRSLLNRVRSSLLSPYWQHNIVAISYWGLLFYLIQHYHLWSEFCIVWLIPLTVLYHISRTLRLIVEHTWPEEAYLNNRNLDFISASTIAVFLGTTFPNKTKNPFNNIFAYSKWLFKMFTIHLFGRVFVLVGDTPCHDHHHRNPSSKNWMNYAYARQEDSKNSNIIHKIPYKEIWGLFRAIDNNLEAMSKVKFSNTNKENPCLI